VTLELFQPFAFAAGEREAVIVGAVLSMLIPLTVSFATFPALSMTVPEADWFAPSEESTSSAEHEATPEVSSAQR
jgi:hypothetical protein